MIIFNMIASLSIYIMPRCFVCPFQVSWSKTVLDSGSLRKQPTFCDVTIGFPRNEVWETSAEIPYWWRVNTQIWVVLLIGRAAWKICFNQTSVHVLFRSHVISMEFLRFFLIRHLAGKPVVASWNVVCFLSLGFWIPFCGFRFPHPGFQIPAAQCNLDSRSQS